MVTMKKVLKRVKVEEKTHLKGLPYKPFSRLVVLKEALENNLLPLGKEIDLSKTKIQGRLFEELISSRPLIGNSTRKGLLQAGYKCIPIKLTSSNRIAIVKFEKA